MSDPLERIIVSAGGPFTGFDSVSISISAEEAARSAVMTTGDPSSAGRFTPGTPVTISCNGTLILTGYVRDFDPSHDGASWSASVTFVSKSVDAVENSIVHPKGWAKEKNIVDLAKEFDTQGVGIESSDSFPVEPNHFINPGASLFDEIEPLARAQSAFIYDTPEGKLRIAKKPRGRHSGAIQLGVNIVSASAHLTENGRHNPVIVRGQSTSGDGKGALRLEARAQDGGVKRQRPKIIIDEAETTSGRLKGRAERHVKRAAGASREATVTVSGWRDQGGKIWEPHFTVRLDDAKIGLAQDMAIKSVELRQDQSGTIAILSLADPRAMNGEAAAGGSSGAVWNTPDVLAKVLGA